MDDSVFCFGPFRLAVRERELTRDHVPIHLGSRAFDLLVTLVEQAGRTVNREELLSLVWPDVVVSKVNLRVHIASLRKALGDGQDGNRFIISVSGRGYRFIGSLRRIQSAAISADRLISYGGSGRWDPRRVTVVDCLDIRDPEQIATTLASALGCPSDAHKPLARVLALLRNREMLLVFDNCEHVFAGVTNLAETLFAEAPRVQVLACSRWSPRPTIAWTAIHPATG